MSPRDYLLDRFTTDAAVLRQRAETLRTSPPQPGPDAAVSAQMAAACEDVVALLTALPVDDDVDATLDALDALRPLIDQRANRPGVAAPVRAVYAGAATRLREVVAAERAHAAREEAGEAAATDTDGHASDRDDGPYSA